MRRHLFRRWQARNRTDSRLCRDAVYNEKQCASVRRLATSNRNAFTILSGAAYSGARRRRPDEDRTCPWCHQALGSWEQAAWNCPNNVPPCRRPATNLEARFGWGGGVVFDHLQSTRLKLLPYLRELSRREAQEADKIDPG